MKYFFNYWAQRCVRTVHITYVLDDHDQEGKLDGKGLLGIDWACDVVGRNVGSHDLENGRLNIRISYSLDVSVSNVLVPDLKWLGSTRKRLVKICLSQFGDSHCLGQNVWGLRLTRWSKGWRGNRSGMCS